MAGYPFVKKKLLAPFQRPEKCNSVLKVPFRDISLWNRSENYHCVFYLPLNRHYDGVNWSKQQDETSPLNLIKSPPCVKLVKRQGLKLSRFSGHPSNSHLLFGACATWETKLLLFLHLRKMVFFNNSLVTWDTFNHSVTSILIYAFNCFTVGL